MREGGLERAGETAHLLCDPSRESAAITFQYICGAFRILLRLALHAPNLARRHHFLHPFFDAGGDNVALSSFRISCAALASPFACETLRQSVSLRLKISIAALLQSA
jgi:hypothetical protein